jgi:hypothetical protein
LPSTATPPDFWSLFEELNEGCFVAIHSLHAPDAAGHYQKLWEVTLRDRLEDEPAVKVLNASLLDAMLCAMTHATKLGWVKPERLEALKHVREERKHEGAPRPI